MSLENMVKLLNTESAVDLLPADAEKKLGICVRTEPSYAVIWSPELDLVSWSGSGYLEIPIGSWVLFKSTKAKAKGLILDVFGLIKQTAYELEPVQNRRNTKSFGDAIQVEAIFKSYTFYNEVYYLAKDDLLGEFLLPKDPYIRTEISDRQTVKVALAFIPREKVSHWIAVAVFDRDMEGEPGYRKINYLPEYIDRQAAAYYNTVAPERESLQPKYLTSRQQQLIRTQRNGDMHGRYPLYHPDKTATPKVAQCLIVRVDKNSALGYNKIMGLILIKIEIFKSRSDFEKICKLGQWVMGVFFRPLKKLPSGKKVEFIAYSWMADSDLEPIKAPSNTRVVRVSDTSKEGPNDYVQVKVDCHFIEPNLTQTINEGWCYLRTNFCMICYKCKSFTDLLGKSVSTWITYDETNYYDPQLGKCWKLDLEMSLFELQGKVVKKREDYMEIELSFPKNEIRLQRRAD